MHVGARGSGNDDPLIRGIVEAFAPGVNGASGVLIAAPPGFGKTSVLTAASRLLALRSGASVLWVSGGVVASEGHLVRLLLAAAEKGDLLPGTRLSFDASIAALLATAGRPVVLALDDFDTLVFKRERVAEQIATAIVTNSNISLLATCHPASASRLSALEHPFSAALHAAGRRVRLFSIGALDDVAARALIQRRAPKLSNAAARAVILAAGGHPAALVFLSRLAELRAGGIATDSSVAFNRLDAGDRVDTNGARSIGELIGRAAEFAGTVYAESWAGLGPQQRAILWRLGTTGVPTTAAEIAESIELPASHVSAQLTRLVADGLVRRTTVRGQFTLAPLLAAWIVRRAAPNVRHGTRQSSGPSQPSRSVLNATVVRSDAGLSRPRHRRRSP